MKNLHEQVALVGRRIYRFTKACHPIIAVHGGGEIAELEDGIGAIIEMKDGHRLEAHFDRDEDTVRLGDLVIRGVDELTDDELTDKISEAFELPEGKKYYVIGTFGNIETETLAGPFDDFHQAKVEADYLWFGTYNQGRSRHTPSMGHNSGITAIGISMEVKNV